MTTEERLARIRANHETFHIIIEEDVLWLLELVDDMADQRKELFRRLPPRSHWCSEWDGLLILPSDPEWEACICYA